MAIAQEVEFNYEGLVKLDGIPYNGPGYFKFAIVNQQGDVTLWSNDGTVAGGVEPATAVSVDVLDGVFNVIIGDASTENMEPLVASIFNAKEKVFLRVWFSDSLAGPYEQLSPDRAITNPALLGSQLFSGLDIYVDPVLGDDRFPGLHSSHPKRTIQSAWDALPALIKDNVTIHLADGVYRESVRLAGKTIIGDATILLLGDPASPDSVRITGADSGAETTAVREDGFSIVSQRNLTIQGVLLDYYGNRAIHLEVDAYLTLSDCKLLYNTIGILMSDSNLTISDVEIGNGIGSSRGMSLNDGSLIMRMENCYIHDVVFGVRTGNSNIQNIYGTTVSNCTCGYRLSALTYVLFGTGNTIGNCTTGIHAMLNSVVTGSTAGVTFSNNGTNRTSEQGGTYYN
jgi:hypothetical protein